MERVSRMDDLSLVDIKQLKRTELQRLCKQNKIKATGKVFYYCFTLCSSEERNTVTKIGLIIRLIVP